MSVCILLTGGTTVINNALIIAVLNNGLTIMNVSFFWQLVIRGIVIIIAVVIDTLRAGKRAFNG